MTGLNSTVHVLIPEELEAAEPKPRAYCILENSGLGVRVYPSGRKSWIFKKYSKGNFYYHTIGDFAAIPVWDARASADRLNDLIKTLHAAGPDTPFEVFADAAMFRLKAPLTANAQRLYRDQLRTNILPHFSGRPIGEIGPADVEEWRDGMRSRPRTASQALRVLARIMRVAVEVGALPEGGNPCDIVRRFKNASPRRVPTELELGKIEDALKGREEKDPLKTALVRLYMHTDCPLDELRRLNWRDYSLGELNIRDGKGGTRYVVLSSAAMSVLDGLPRWRDDRIFPHRNKSQRMISLGHFWGRLRAEAGLGDMKFSDLRNAYANRGVSSTKAPGARTV